MAQAYKIRTDLALECKEKFEHDQVEIPGVVVEESRDVNGAIKTTKVVIENKQGEEAMGKPIGMYVTIEVSDLSMKEEISKVLADHLRDMMNLNVKKKILVTGLGNRDITPDALGPYVVKNLLVNRHLEKETNDAHMISAIVPGVMAQTGMETFEIVKGIVDETKPDMVVAVDALAARSIKRLNCTIQVSDTGINPGSGVMNHRHGLNQESLGVPVIAIGVPTVVDAATIVYDSMEHLLQTLEQSDAEGFLEEIISDDFQTMFVTPKDVDETVKDLSLMIAKGLDMAFAYV